MPLQAHERKHVVFRGDLRAGIEGDGDAIARLALKLARESGTAVCVNIDELDRVLTDGGRSWTAPSVRTVLSQGRAINAWLVWTTQQPQRIPNEPYDQATALCLFRLEAKAARYMEKVCMFDDRMTSALPQLERGQFVLHRPGAAWDGKTYIF
jgi:hypothetical protein